MKFKAPVFVLFIVAAFVSCKKEDDPLPSPPATYIDFLNVSTEVLNFFQNGNRLNNNASLYPNGATGYLSVTAGTQNFQVKRMGSPDVLFNLPLTLDTLKSYSLFAAGSTADDMLLVDDSFTRPDSAVAMVRFVNASPETISLDIALRDTAVNGATATITNRAYKSVSDFIEVPIGAKQLKVLAAGSSTAFITDTVELQSRKAYTIFAKGRLTQTGDGAFGAGVINNQ